MKKKLRCWEVFECNKKECPVYKSKELRCWLISGTHCRDEIQGKFLEKMEMCLDCEVFKANMDVAAMEGTLKVINKQFKEFKKIVEERDKEMEDTGLELALGLSEVFEALNKIASGDPRVKISEVSENELIAQLKQTVNKTSEGIGTIVDQSHEFAIGLAEHFDILHKVSKGDLNARISESSQEELLKALGSVTNEMIESVSREITERKKAEESLRESEEKYRSFVENIPDVTWMADQEGKVIFISPNVEKVLGYTPEEIYEESDSLWFGKIHPDDVEQLKEAFKVLFTGTDMLCFDAEYRTQRKDGEWIWLRNRASVTRVKDGVIYADGIARDITERKRVEEALKHSEKKYRDLIDNTLVGIYQTSLKGDILFVNDALVRMLEFESPEEMISRSVLERYKNPKDREVLIENLKKTSKVTNFEVELITKTGKTKDVLLTAILTGDVLSGMIMDITERKAAIEALRESEYRYRNMIESSHDIIQSVGPDGRFIFVNTAWCETLGYTESELADINLFQIIHPDSLSHCQGLFQKIMSGEAVKDIQTTFLTKDGRSIIVEGNVSPRIIGDKVIATQGFFHNITDRKQREREMEAIVTMATVLRAAQTRADMLSVILNQLIDLIKAEGAALAMRDPFSGETVIELARGEWVNWTGLRLPPGEGVSGHVIETGRPYLNSDIMSESLLARPDLIGDLRAVACVPLIVHGQTIGVLWMGRKTEITNDEVRMLSAIGDIAANAIHRATLYEQAECHMQRLAALHAIDMAIGASLDLRVTLNVLLDQVTTQLHTDAATVLLLNPYTQMLEYAAGRGFRTSALQYTRLRLGEGYAGRAVLDRQIVSIPNLAEAKNGLKRSPLLLSEGFINYYAVPLIAKGQVKGVLEVFHRSPFVPDPAWLDFFEALAAQAAIAIDNATLFNDLQRSNIELALAYDTTLEGWSKALDLRDKETEGHTQRVTEMTIKLAHVMGISESELVHVRRGALLHDIGKMGISDTILLKPGPLTDEEWEVMRKHPTYAYEMLSHIAFLRPALDIPYCHHEKWDGTGYPRGLKGEQIPLVARIFAVVDVWDALCSDRPYRPAWSEEKARDYIRQQAGKHFDSKVVEAFLEMKW